MEMILNFRAHRTVLMTVSYNSGLEFLKMSKDEEEEKFINNSIEVLLSLTS